MLLWIFQSTLPARGATEYVTRDELNTLTFQSTLPARGATDGTALPCRQARISIHAPRTGSDSDDKKVLQKHLDFNPRSPHGERQAQQFQIGSIDIISIHAPRTGSDRIPAVPRVNDDISIHAPRTGSDISAVDLHLLDVFQSTLPARGATSLTVAKAAASWQFQSTLPARGATFSTIR